MTGNYFAEAYVWNADTGKLVRTLRHQPAGTVFQAVFSAQGSLLVTATAGGAVRFWDAGTGAQLGTPVVHHGPVSALAISPDGRTIVTGEVNQNAQLWDVATRHRLFRLSGHHDAVNDAAFSPDGRFVVTGSRDGSARIWDVASGKLIGPPLPHQGPVVRVLFGRDGKTILTATQDQATRAWPVPDAMTGTPEQIERWAQVATGMELEVDGEVQILDSFAWRNRVAVRHPSPSSRQSGD